MTNKKLAFMAIPALAAIMIVGAFAPASAGFPEFSIAPLDVKPQSCPNPINVNSQGVIPVAILGTEDFDVTQIDTSFWDGEGWKIAYEDVSTPYEGPIELIDDCTEEGPDGYVDLVIKIPGVFFCAPDGQVGYITVGGELLDGTPFTTTPDVVTIINKKVDCPV